VQRFTIEVEYPSAGALRVEVETQLALGGLLLDVAPPEALLVGMPVRLRLMVTEAAGTPAVIEIGAIVGERDAGSLCLEVDEAAVATLRATQPEVVTGERAAAAVPAVRFSSEGAPAGAASHAEPTAAGRIEPIERRLAAMSVGEKIQQALHGGREWRQLLARDRAGVIQSALIRNPRVTIDEVTALARGPGLAPDAAEALAQHPSFGASTQIALALVRNPRTPLPSAITMVARLSPNDLRSIAKGAGVRAQVAAAAKKRLANDR